MQKFYHTNPTRFQAIRLFHVIQQLSFASSSSSHIIANLIINADSLDKFLKAINLPRQQDLVKFMHEIDKNDKQMRAQYWGYSISRALNDFSVFSQSDYLELHGVIKQLLSGLYVPALRDWQLWDGLANKTIKQKDGLYAKIVNLCGQLSFFISKIDYMIFNTNIESINLCFSLINLFPNKQSEIFQIYENILKGTFLQTLQFALTMNVSQNILVQMLKSLCYLYQSLKYDKIKKILQPSFLLTPTTLQGLLENIKDKRPQIKYYTCVMMSIMVNNVSILPLLVLNNKKLLYDISNEIAKTRQEQGLMFALQFLVGIVKGFEGFSQDQKKQNMQIISTYLKFAVNKLFELKSQKNQSICIKIVLQIVRIMDLNNQDVKLLKFVTNVFQGPNNSKFKKLFDLTLQIVKYSLVYNRKNVQDFIIGDKSFQNYVKRVLKLHHQDWEPFYSVLQIMFIMASSESCDILFQRDLIQDILRLSQTSNGLVLMYLSQILLSLIINSLDSEWKITYLYQKGCLKTIGNLIGGAHRKDIILQKEYPSQLTINYCNRQTFFNSLKALYFLNFQSPNLSMLKKKQHYIKNFSIYFINQFSQGVINLFRSAESPQYLLAILKQQQSLGRYTHIRDGPFMKLYKIISTVVEQMTLHLRKRNVDNQILKQVNITRNEIYRNFYEVLTYNQLITQNIPIYLIYSADIDGKLLKQRVYRLSWNQFRSLLWQFAKKILSFEVDSFRIIDKSTGIQLKNEEDYRKVVQKVLLDYRRSKFTIEVSLENIRQKLVQPQRQMFGSMRGPEPDMYRRDIPRFASYRMPQARDNSPYNSQRRGDSANRNRSPNFGSPCRQCSRSTTNRTQICNICAQNR